MYFNLRINTLLVIFTVFALSAYAQNRNGNYVKIGPKLGLDINADIHNLPSGEEIVGQLENNNQVGIFAQFGRKLYLQPELMYAVQNYTDNLGNRSNNKYLRVPLHAGLKFFNLGFLSLHVSAGAIYTQRLEDSFSISAEKLNYQLGLGVDLLDFITTDIRYTLAKDIPVGEQLSNFSEQGGLINFSVGLKL